MAIIGILLFFPFSIYVHISTVMFFSFAFKEKRKKRRNTFVQMDTSMKGERYFKQDFRTSCCIHQLNEWMHDIATASAIKTSWEILQTIHRWSLIFRWSYQNNSTKLMSQMNVQILLFDYSTSPYLISIWPTIFHWNKSVVRLDGDTIHITNKRTTVKSHFMLF